ncbi:MAG: hypothetical protein JWM57_3218 [Phycisphaerales bacterium]|nr:hypothetical protein [Phycisphaerales bacterium]
MLALLDAIPKNHGLAGGLFAAGGYFVLKMAWSQSMGEITHRGKYERTATVLSNRHESPMAFAILIAVGYLLGLALLFIASVAYLG